MVRQVKFSCWVTHNLGTPPLKYFKNEELKKTVENISKQEGFQVETANEIALIP